MEWTSYDKKRKGERPIIRWRDEIQKRMRGTDMHGEKSDSLYP